MNIADTIRSRTLAIRDVIASIKSQISRLEGQRDAAEERIKRASTEITKQRTLEVERNRSFNAASEKVEEAQGVLAEIDRKRQDAIDHLIRCQDEHRLLYNSLRESQEAKEAALADIRKEQKDKQEAEFKISELRDQLEQKGTLFCQTQLETLEFHLRQQTEYVMAAFETQEQRQKALIERDALRKARHTEPEIANLCDQRDEFKKFLSTSMVPGVKEMLLSELKTIENELQKRFPGALQSSDLDILPSHNQIDELLFYCDHDGKAVFLLPLRSSDWEGAECDEPTDDSSKAMCIVWNMIRDLKIKRSDGEFISRKGRVEFISKFDLEEVAILQGFSVKYNNFDVLHFILTAVPAELQEVLSYE